MASRTRRRTASRRLLRPRRAAQRKSKSRQTHGGKFQASTHDQILQTNDQR
jgi:hypothetical protein